MKSEIRSHPRVVQFLDRVCAHVPGSKKRAEVREELLSHLESALESVEEPSDEFVSTIISKFGDPKALGQSLKIAQRTWPRRVLTYTLSASMLSVFALYFSSLYFVSHYNAILDALNQKVASRMPRFEADQKTMRSIEMLRETSRVFADAGTYMNLRIRWPHSGTEPEIDVPEAINSSWHHGLWLVTEIPAELKNVDLGWINKLHQFDHWDLFATGPNSVLIGEAVAPMNPYLVELPDLSFVSRAARLHLRRGLDSGEIERALNDIRHLARLSYTTETLVGNSLAVGLLKIERTAYDEAVKRKLFLSARYQAFDPEILKKMKTTLWVTAGFADYAAPEVVRRTFLESPAWPVGSCAALAETAMYAVLAGQLLEKKFPFESDSQNRGPLIQEVFDKSKPHCRLTFQRQIVSRYREYGDAFVDSANISFGSGWRGLFETLRFSYVRHIPYLRQGLGMELLADARPDFSGLYERE